MRIDMAKNGGVFRAFSPLSRFLRVASILLIPDWWEAFGSMF